MRRLSIFVLGVVLLGFTSGAPSFSQGQPSPLGIVIQPTEFQAFIEVSRPVCAVGQTIEIRYRANQAPYYAYILDIQGNNVTRLLPNRFEANNLVNDTEWKRLPGVAGYQLVCAPPLGPEYVQIIASTERIPQLEGGSGTFPLLGTNPQAVGQQIQAILPVGKVATAVAQLQIVSGQPQPPQQCPPGTVGTPPFCTPVTQPPQPPPGGGQFQVQQVIAPGSWQFMQLSAQLMPLLQIAGLSQALAQAQGAAAPPGQPQALGTAPQQINIQEVQNRCELLGVMRTDRTANVSGATLPAGTYLQAFCQVNPYLVVIIDAFTGNIVVIIVVLPPPFFTPISIIIFIYGWLFPVLPGPYPFPWPYPYPFPWPFPVMMPAACTGLPVQNPFSVPIGSGASIVQLPGIMNIRDAGVFFNSLAVQSLGPSLSFQRITGLFSIHIGYIGSFGTATLPYSTLGTFVLVVQGGGKTACIQGVIGFGAVYGLAAHN